MTTKKKNKYNVFNLYNFPPALRARLQRVADREARSLSFMILEAIRYYLDYVETTNR